MLTIISSHLWAVTTFILIITSVFFFFYLYFPPKNISKRVNKSDKNVSNDNLKLLNFTLASRIGVGSISGVAFSIIVGGPGTVFWIWISSLFLPIITFIETKAGIINRKKKEHGNIGGPQVYLNDQLGKKRLSILYSVIIILTYLFAFILIQSNTIIISLGNTLNIKKIIIVLILSLITYISISKGIERVSKITSFLVPIMGSVYIIIGLIIITKNINLIPSIIKQIVNDAFDIKTTRVLPLIIGFQRSIFANETGMGSTSMVVAISNSNDYKKEAKYQLIGMYFITLIICSISALLILSTNYRLLSFNNVNGIEIINYAFEYHFGYIGIYLSTIIISLFAFSTIITSYYYGEMCIRYLINNKRNTIAQIIVIIVISISALIPSNKSWAIVDILCALMTLINLYALYKIRRQLKE